MSTYDESIKAVTLEAGSDLSAGQYKFVALASDGQVDLVAGSGARSDGVLLNKPSAAGHAATIGISGVVRVVAGTGNLTRGDLVMSDSDGTGITATSTGFVLGRALATGAAGTKVPVLLISPAHFALS